MAARAQADIQLQQAQVREAGQEIDFRIQIWGHYSGTLNAFHNMLASSYSFFLFHFFFRKLLYISLQAEHTRMKQENAELKAQLRNSEAAREAQEKQATVSNDVFILFAPYISTLYVPLSFGLISLSSINLYRWY